MARQHHPIADLFPMLTEGELRDLSEDIKQRGQLQPIVLDSEGRILDGRNRYAACELAGVEPWFEKYDGDDPDGYALAVNVNRREMTKWQKAMVATSADFLVAKRRGEQQRSARLLGVSGTLLSQAATVRKFAPELVEGVIAGKSLDEAYRTAKQRKDEAKSRDAKVNELRKIAPDLAVLVDNEIRDLDDALKEASHRATVAEVDDILTADEAPEPTFASRAESGTITWDEAATLAQRWRTERDEQLQRNKGRLDDLRRGLTRGLGIAMEVRNKIDTRYITDLLALYSDNEREELLTLISKIKEA